MFAYAKMASLCCVSLVFSLLAGCAKPNVEDAKQAISRFDAMSPGDVLCNPNKLSAFRGAVRRYAKAKQADGVMWPDFTYRSARPDDLTVTVLAGQYVSLLSAKDIGKAAWHLGELKPRWSPFRTSVYDLEPISAPDSALLRNGAKYACSDLVDYGRALAELRLGEAYWRERLINETILSGRRAEMKADLVQRASKRMEGDWRKVIRLEQDLVRSVDAAQLAQR